MLEYNRNYMYYVILYIMKNIIMWILSTGVRNINIVWMLLKGRKYIVVWILFASMRNIVMWICLQGWKLVCVCVWFVINYNNGHPYVNKNYLPRYLIDKPSWVELVALIKCIVEIFN
jgi:hypothetical protein